jgi:predicted phosphodiesterase
LTRDIANEPAALVEQIVHFGVPSANRAAIIGRSALPKVATHRTLLRSQACQMPNVFFQPIDRHEFLKYTATAAGLVLASPMAKLFGGEADANCLRLALLADTHIPADPAETYRNFAPLENLKQILPQVVESRPAGVIINGDAARLEGLTGDYEQLRDLLAPVAAEFPIYISLGNHDDRRNFRAAFPDDAIPAQRQSVRDKHVLILEYCFVRMIILDSLLYVNKVAGLLGKAQRTWLQEYLASCDDRPTVLFVHHTLGDGDGDLLDADRLFRLVLRHKQVKAIFYGHSHAYAVDRRRRLQLINIPATGYNFDDVEPVGWIDAVFHCDGVDLTLRTIGGNQEANGQTRHVRWIGTRSRRKQNA